MAIRSLGATGPQVFNLKRQTSSSGQPQVQVMTLEELATLMNAQNSGVSSLNNPDSSAQQPIIVVTTPSPPPTVISSRDRGGAPWPINLVIQAINLSALLGLTALIGGVALKYGKHWGFLNSDGKFEKIPQALHNFKLDDKLPDKLVSSVKEAWKEIDSQYKEGFNANEEITLGGYLEALQKLFDANPDKAIELAGRTHGALENFFKEKLPNFTNWWKGFTNNFQQTSDVKANPKGIDILDGDALREANNELLNKLNSISTEGPDNLIGIGENRVFKKFDETTVDEKLNFITSLRVLLSNHGIILSTKARKDLEELQGYLRKLSINQDELKTYLEDKEKSKGIWSRILQTSNKISTILSLEA